jgi:hypothetical protein
VGDADSDIAKSVAAHRSVDGDAQPGRMNS